MISTHKLIELGFPHQQADWAIELITTWQQELSDTDCWQKISEQILNKELPFELHQYLYHLVYQARDSHNPGPAWLPKLSDKNIYNILRFMEQQHIDTYQQLHQFSTEQYVQFWQAVIKTLNIIFKTPYTSICQSSDMWLKDAKLNIADSCFCAPGQKTALIYQDIDNHRHTVSYQELDILSNRVANGLIAQNLQQGDHIAIAMPMTLEAVAIYLGIIKAGCAVVAILDSFSVAEMNTRLTISNAKAIFAQDVIIRRNKTLPLYEKTEQTEVPLIIVLPAKNKLSISLRTSDISWEQFLPNEECFTTVACNPHDISNILFSSGTTGTPKAIPWDHTSPIKVASDGYFHQDIQPDDIVAWPTNLGWMMGPWLLYATFINQATMALFYDAPTEQDFVQFIEETKVSILGLVPSLVKHWRNKNYLETADWSNIKCFSSSGESSNPDDMLYLMAKSEYKPIIEYCGGTEISGAYITSTLIQPNIPGAFSTPALGLNFDLFDENHHITDKGEVGLLGPSIGLSRTLLNKDHHEIYYQGMPTHQNKTIYRRHGDQLERLKQNYYRALGRIDDTMNLGGTKISAAEIENCFQGIPAVNETAAIAVSPAQGGPSQLVVYVVLTLNYHTKIDINLLQKEMQQAINKKLNPLFKIHNIKIIDNLPRTASNKIMRRVLRDNHN